MELNAVAQSELNVDVPAEVNDVFQSVNEYDFFVFATHAIRTNQ